VHNFKAKEFNSALTFFNLQKLSFPSSDPAWLTAIYAFIAHGKKHVGIEDLKIAYESVKFGVLDDHVQIVSFLIENSKLPKEQVRYQTSALIMITS